jgi:hypothetical protein
MLLLSVSYSLFTYGSLQIAEAPAVILIASGLYCCGSG